jgi:hypothetical protein
MPRNTVTNSHFAYGPLSAAFNFRRAISIVTLLPRINAVLASRIFGIGNDTQSFEEADRTMYALLSDVNIIATDANPTHMPMR